MSIYTADTVFSEVFDSITDTLEYNKEWENGAGYFDAAVHHKSVNVKPGEMAKSIDDKGRRIIFVGTRIGNFVVFDRFSTNTNDPENAVFVSNSPRDLFRAGMCQGPGKIDYKEMTHLLRDNIRGRNIGQKLNNLLVDIQEYESNKAA